MPSRSCADGCVFLDLPQDGDALAPIPHEMLEKLERINAKASDFEAHMPHKRASFGYHHNGYVASLLKDEHAPEAPHQARLRKNLSAAW